MKKKLSQDEIAANQYSSTGFTNGAIIPASGTLLQNTSGSVWSQNWYMPSPQEAAYQTMKADILAEVLTELKKGLISKDNK